MASHALLLLGFFLTLRTTRALAPHFSISAPLRFERPLETRHVLMSEGPSPDEWREFRQRLITRGLPLTSEDGVEEPSRAEGEGQVQRQSVAPANEALLAQQNAKLFEEYMNGAWAHVSPLEAGGLACRLPLQAQLTEQMRQQPLALSNDDDLAVSESDTLGTRLQKMLLRELPAVADGGADKRAELEKTWNQNSAYCFRLADRLLIESLQGVAARATDGKIDARSLKPHESQLVQLYQESQEEWQQVVLVLGVDGSQAEGVALNRPLGRGINAQLAQLLLSGELSSTEAAAAADDFMLAFGREGAVYVGGPSKQREGGLLVHGFGHLEGAVEVSPGTRIYRGGALAAIDAVKSGELSPLDFRWFVGRQTGISTAEAGWSAVACARPLALKQCLGLPKPLWHEVLELCGGDLAVWSQIELMKRTDLDTP
uniref:Selenoprotein O n=1 Tax=Coccolithus braarudii TaxID=221442 RepID=A0A7S0LJD4_9EUKA